ncbi:MAG TPA: FkbM family methyltransferase [Vicinamibacterales bacterium]|nr:FkbM family methyltransferase [Vicinamibacterales bacterium]
MSDQGLTREHVVWAYRILLDRDPESESVILPKQRGYQTTRELRADIMTSQEFLEKNRDYAHTNARNIVIKELEGGCRLFIDLSDHAISLNILRGRFEPGELAFLRRTIRPEQHVLDVGAHIGFFTIHMAALVGPRGSVRAYEPMDENADLLVRSIRENGFEGRVQYERAAVGGYDGTIDLAFATETLNSGGAFVVTGTNAPRGHATRRVPIVALDSQELRRPVAFIKMDAEGAEALVLEGARHLIAADRPVILSELHAEQLARVSGRSVDQFLLDVRELGYRTHRLEGDSPGAEITSTPSEAVASVVMLPQ